MGDSASPAPLPDWSLTSGGYTGPCSICQLDLTDCSVAACTGHAFHLGCLVVAVGSDSRCPVCRIDMSTVGYCMQNPLTQQVRRIFPRHTVPPPVVEPPSVSEEARREDALAWAAARLDVSTDTDESWLLLGDDEDEDATPPQGPWSGDAAQWAHRRVGDLTPEQIQEGLIVMAAAAARATGPEEERHRTPPPSSPQASTPTLAQVVVHTPTAPDRRDRAPPLASSPPSSGYRMADGRPIRRQLHLDLVERPETTDPLPTVPPLPLGAQQLMRPRSRSPRLLTWGLSPPPQSPPPKTGPAPFSVLDLPFRPLLWTSGAPRGVRPPPLPAVRALVPAPRSASLPLPQLGGLLRPPPPRSEGPRSFSQPPLSQGLAWHPPPRTLPRSLGPASTRPCVAQASSEAPIKVPSAQQPVRAPEAPTYRSFLACRSRTAAVTTTVTVIGAAPTTPTSTSTSASLAAEAAETQTMRWVSIVKDELTTVSGLLAAVASSSRCEAHLEHAVSDFKGATLLRYLNGWESWADYALASNLDPGKTDLAPLVDFFAELAEGARRDRGARRKGTPQSVYSGLHFVFTHAQVPDMLTLLNSRLVQSYLKAQRGSRERREGLPLPMGTVVMMEQRVCSSDCPAHETLLIGKFLHDLWGGLRFSDGQRAAPSALLLDHDVLRGSCWATKVCNSGQPYAAHAFGLSRRPPSWGWAHHWLAALRTWLESSQKELGSALEVDFLLPDMQSTIKGTTEVITILCRPMPYVKALTRFRRMLQAPWMGAHRMTATEAHAYGLHLKVTLLSWARQLDISEGDRGEQGHHRADSSRASVRLYSRDDVWGQIRLQRALITSAGDGWRPMRAQGRGGQLPAHEPPVSIPSVPGEWMKATERLHPTPDLTPLGARPAHLASTKGRGLDKNEADPSLICFCGRPSVLNCGLCRAQYCATHLALCSHRAPESAHSQAWASGEDLTAALELPIVEPDAVEEASSSDAASELSEPEAIPASEDNAPTTVMQWLCNPHSGVVHAALPDDADVPDRRLIIGSTQYKAACGCLLKLKGYYLEACPPACFSLCGRAACQRLVEPSAP